MTITRGPGAPPVLPAPEPVPGLLRDLVLEKTGIFFESDRLDNMLEKLEERAVANGCTSYLDYYYVLKYDEKGPAEWLRVMDAFSVQETYFWREFDQVRFLIEVIIPGWFRTRSDPFRIWSAACATGEEPYSIAMAIEEAGLGHLPIEILASDASEAALAKAKAGFYRERSFRALPVPLREKYFTQDGETAQLNELIRHRVTFRWANLMALDDLPEGRRADVIFCRNVFIYFSQSTISHVLHSFANRLPPQGRLFVGASESLLKLTEQFDLVDEHSAFSYVRNTTK